jgi:peptidoglycan-associated lipoprotein
MNRLFIVFGLLLALAGCASNVKLDEAPVEDKSGSAPQQASAPAAPATSAVTTIRANNLPTMDPGPTGVSKVIYFDYDSFVIKAESQSVIEAHARYLRADKNRRVAIEGHADERGGREYNLALGQKRSESVRKALGLLGVADSQLEAVSFGKEKPSDPGHDEAAWSKNRRAEIAYR